MKRKLTVVTAVLIVVMSTPAYSFPGFFGFLEATPGSPAKAEDIILFQCSNQLGITQASAYVQDVNTLKVNPTFQVRIAAATSPTTCPAATSAAWNTVRASDVTTPATAAEVGAWSTRTGNLAIGTSGYYCLKVTRVTGTVKDDYQLIHFCEVNFYAGHLWSSAGVYKQNQ
jgi:hypothetical protein